MGAFCGNFRWGRKITFLVASVMQVLFGVLAAFAPEFWTFAVSRMILGAAASGVFLVAYVMGKQKKRKLGQAFNFFLLF